MEDRYKSLNAPELAGEDAFIRWVIKGENDDHWSQWLAINPQQAENINEARHIVKAISNLPAESMDATTKNELWQKINASVQTQPKLRIRKTPSFIRWSIAAAAALTLFIWINSPDKAIRVMADAGERTETRLPESSEVIINAGSELTYNKKTFKNDREVQLKGEAFFKVKPGSTFTVKTEYGKVTVLGTSFNVIDRPGRFEVSCFTGKVKVENRKGNHVELTAGEKVFRVDQSLQSKPFSPSETPEWMQGRFIFENQPLFIVVEELERQYKVDVILEPGIEYMKYNGLFEGGDLDEALRLITWPLHLNARNDGKSISIYRG